jgi:tripartite-type tricarboxylate transporter receptor subunit TctC
MKARSKRRELLAASCAMFVWTIPLQAQPYPVKPIRILLGFPPGGGSDVLARILAQKVTESTGQQVIIENRPGANGNIAAAAAMRSVPDGYLITIIAATLAFNQAIDANIGFDLEKDFLPVGGIGTVPFVVAVHPSVPANSLKELIALARARPGQLSYSSSGSLGLEHVAAAMLASAANIQLLHVPYKGGGPAAVAVVAGEVAVSFNGLPAALPHIRNGRLKLLAVTGERRATPLPKVPTVAEAGVPGYSASVWYGVLAPAGTPREIIGRLSTEFGRALGMADVKERLAGLGVDPLEPTPEAFGAHIRSEIRKYRRIIKEANLKAE